MAGFADEIAHFNPYISQIPVDDYINSGMQLQRKYDEGVAHAQSSIDSVAGLPVAGEANVQYLHNKIGELESKVSKVVGGDFAKTSLPNQIGGLSGLIYRDPVIQAGMTSAVRLQKYQKAWDDLKKDHPDQYSDKNKEYSDQYVNDYLKQSQSKTGLVYSGPQDATPYYDYYSKLDKELKGLDPSIQTSISPAGEFMYKVDKSSTISRDKIDSVLNSALLGDSRAQQQMQIDAWSSYRSFDGMGMFDHVNKSFGAMIDNYQQNSKYYQGVIKSNPNDYQTVSAAQKKITDFNVEVKTLQTNRDNYLKELNQGNVDGVKQAVFNDSIRQGLILKYERNNIETDLKNNENSIQAAQFKYKDAELGLQTKHFYLDALKEGIDPETGLGIAPGDKYYTAWLNVLANKRASAKAAKAGETDAEQQSVAVSGIVPDSYTEDQHNSAIQNTQNEITGNLTKLRSYHSNMSDTEWKNYLATQEGKYQAGDETVDPKYAQFKSITQPQQALLDTYINVSKKIHTDAANANKLTDVLPTRMNINDVVVNDTNGARKTNVSADRETVEKAIELNRVAKADIDRIQHNYAPGQTISQANLDLAYQRAGEKYQGDTNFKYITALARSNSLNKYTAIADDVLAKRQTYTNSAFRDYGRTISYQAQPIIGKKEVIDQIRRLTATAAAQGGDNVEADKLNPLNYYNNDQGKVVIQYQKEKDGQTYQVEVPAAKNLLGNPDPYQQISRVIDISPTKSTPLDPKSALSSVNGKIKYVIQKDPLGGDYELRLWHKGALYTVPSFSLNGDSFSKPNIGSYVERVEELSKLTNDQFDQLMKASF